eukprot:c8570_g1_i1.p1 GENE.c8570_g1_i1~~c8570_g1_i1.p1  ORF type:complete len:290 (+),score=56.39 c8570_g1_i1:27-896(+)
MKCLVAALSVLFLGAVVADNVDCSSWDECWKCADNSDESRGGCSWNTNACEQSDTGTTNPAGCSEQPDSIDYNCRYVLHESSLCNDDPCCSDYWNCLISIASQFGDIEGTDSALGTVITRTIDDLTSTCTTTCGADAEYCAVHNGDHGGDFPAAECSVWEKCWACASNSEEHDGGCSWNDGACTQSTDGTTDPTECDDAPDSFIGFQKCNTKFGDTCEERHTCCQDFWDCLADVLNEFGSVDQADSETGEIVSHSSAQFEALCVLQCPKLQCSAIDDSKRCIRFPRWRK